MKRKDVIIHKSFVNKEGVAVLLRHHVENEDTGDFDFIRYAHKDEYYLFFFLQKGTVQFMIDFKEIELKENSILCIVPGQVHSPAGMSDLEGWFLAIDAMFVKDEYKEVFSRLYFPNNIPRLSQEKSEELRQCISLVHKKYSAQNKLIGQRIFLDLVSSYIGLFAEIFQQELPLLKGNRMKEIASQFKALLTTSYQTMKRPNEYAAALRISPVYLNEAVKNTTGFPVRDCIRNEIIVQAKRLLYYTDMTIKEIAIELGYVDWAYFTRMFTKSTKVTPSQFRHTYLK